MIRFVVFEPMSRMTEQPVRPGWANLSALQIAIGETSTTRGLRPAPRTASVTARTASSFAATMIAAFSPSAVVPRNWWSLTISSIGNGTFCSIS